MNEHAGPACPGGEQLQADTDTGTTRRTPGKASKAQMERAQRPQDTTGKSCRVPRMETPCQVQVGRCLEPGGSTGFQRQGRAGWGRAHPSGKVGLWEPDGRQGKGSPGRVPTHLPWMRSGPEWPRGLSHRWTKEVPAHGGPERPHCHCCQEVWSGLGSGSMFTMCLRLAMFASDGFFLRRETGISWRPTHGSLSLVSSPPPEVTVTLKGVGFLLVLV